MESDRDRPIPLSYRVAVPVDRKSRRHNFWMVTFALAVAVLMPVLVFIAILAWVVAWM